MTRNRLTSLDKNACFLNPDWKDMTNSDESQLVQQV